MLLSALRIIMLEVAIPALIIALKSVLYWLSCKNAQGGVDGEGSGQVAWDRLGRLTQPRASRALRAVDDVELCGLASGRFGLGLGRKRLHRPENCFRKPPPVTERCGQSPQLVCCKGWRKLDVCVEGQGANCISSRAAPSCKDSGHHLALTSIPSHFPELMPVTSLLILPTMYWAPAM